MYSIATGSLHRLPQIFQAGGGGCGEGARVKVPLCSQHPFSHMESPKKERCEDCENNKFHNRAYKSVGLIIKAWWKKSLCRRRGVWRLLFSWKSQTSLLLRSTNPLQPVSLPLWNCVSKILYSVLLSGSVWQPFWQDTQILSLFITICCFL